MAGSTGATRKRGNPARARSAVHFGFCGPVEEFRGIVLAQ